MNRSLQKSIFVSFLNALETASKSIRKANDNGFSFLPRWPVAIYKRGREDTMDQASETPPSEAGYQTVAELLYVAKLTRAHVEIALRVADLRPGQDEVICALSTEAPMTNSEVADRLRIRSSTVSKMTDKLVAKGLVERTPLESDHRKIALALTAAGAETQALVRDIWCGVEENLFGELSASETEEIRTGLQLLDSRLLERVARFRRPLDQSISENDPHN
ncbi:MarR family winged helix-turn-helix transcriptional regulator [Aurantimonas coralicida]|uniref:MarR family winged helix-turn-helix transcriptional regulator n=1 Tax=Aurantimonas coralicida TaxID=182270 RepID=UPI001D18038A|nr:MarR family winged helix-turn-helix transcriptional regulator [Aurantimonas coralicida]MCC4298146.1 MarR family winged helix-turn-helix transcriptional regulator [Aurantimonas coralicida]